jgi:hypothetical protein
MKRTLVKLTLKTETVKVLTDAALREVGGGLYQTETQMASGCLVTIGGCTSGSNQPACGGGTAEGTYTCGVK